VSGAQHRQRGGVIAALVLILLAAAALVSALWQPERWMALTASPLRLGLSAGATLLYLVLLVISFRRGRGGVQAGAQAGVLPVLHASQSGTAESLARQAAAALSAAGVPAVARSLGATNGEEIQQWSRALFVVATTGDGDAPDEAHAFASAVMARPLGLPQLRYGVLALGDRVYPQFCGFGVCLERWLRAGGAQPLFPTIEADRVDEQALSQWRLRLEALAGRQLDAGTEQARYGTWRLASRQCLNPGSSGGPVYSLRLEPTGVIPDWQAGDIAELLPPQPAAAVEALLQRLGMSGDERVGTGAATRSLREQLSASEWPEAALLSQLPHDASAAQALAHALRPMSPRAYSIASLPQDGGIDLLLREARRPDGSLGPGSAWLIENGRIGDDVALRLRPNRSFHPPEANRPMLLIGNGTGLAGLRAHLKARIAEGVRANWLVFGERQRAHDLYYADDLLRWRDQGWLERLDLAFSRDPPRRCYVHDILAAESATLRDWVSRGAAVYVCGSLKGMSTDVDTLLRECLGAATVERLIEEGRYRRDVY